MAHSVSKLVAQDEVRADKVWDSGLAGTAMQEPEDSLAIDSFPYSSTLVVPGLA